MDKNRVKEKDTNVCVFSYNSNNIKAFKAKIKLVLPSLGNARQRVGDGQGGLACCDSWGRKESGTTEQLN